MTTATQTLRLADDAQRGSHSVQHLVPHHGRKHLDLFSGIGGFALAARWAGFETVAFIEIEPYAQANIKQNFGAVADAESGRDSRSHERAGIFLRPIVCRPRLYSDI